VHRLIDLARSDGVEIEYADLGDWGDDELRSEYDPQGPVIRINSRVLDALPVAQREPFIARCISHELYHHREHRGDIARLPTRAQRERAAGEFEP
jgi:hypothetical protein